MSTALTTFNTQVGILLTSDADIFASASVDAAVKAAVEKYSKDKPDAQVDDVTGDGGKYYGIASELSGWVEGFSRITKIEYPAATIADDETPIYLDPEDWQDDYWASDTRYLWLPSHAPVASEAMRITYTLSYKWSGDPEVTTTPTGDFYAICHWAAGLCCLEIATKFAQSKDSTIAADSAAQSSKSTDFAARAQEFFALYNQYMGIVEEGGAIEPAGEFVDLDTEAVWPSGRQFLFRGKYAR